MKNNHDPKKILVTGGAGFIGTNFIYHWLETHPQDQIINLDFLTYAGNLANLTQAESNPNYTFVEGNICDRDLVNKIMPDIDLVVHFAAESHVDRSILNPSVFIETNVIGTQVLLDAAVKNKLAHFHHISTDEVFGSLELNSAQKFSETTNYQPRSPYSASKAASDHLVRAYGETYDLPYTITNCSNNYGPYQFPEKIIALAITNLMDGLSVPVYGDGLNIRDWLFVLDHCTAIEKVIVNGAQNETYLIGGLTEDISNLDLVKMIIQLMGKSEDMIKFVQDRKGHDRRYAVDWTKIKEELGWQPSVSFEEGLRLTIAWYKDHQDWWRPLKEKSQGFFKENYGQTQSD